MSTESPRANPKRVRGLIRRAAVGTFAVLVAVGPAVQANASGTPSGSASTPSGTSSHSVPGGGGQAKLPRATFGISPATPTHIDNRTDFSYVLAPTAHYDDYAAIRNFSAQPLQLTVSAVDLTNDASGNIEAGLSQATATDAGRWITVEHDLTVSVPGESRSGPGTVIIPFRIVVPSDASVGDHAAEVLVTLSTLSRGKNNQNVLLNQRIGARIYIRVPGAPRAGLAIRNLSAHYSGAFAYPFTSGSVHVRYTLVNTGNVTLSVNQSGSVSGWFGASATAAAKDTPPIPVLLPGRSAVADYVIDDVPPAIIDHFAVTAKASYATDTTLNLAPKTEVAVLPPVSASTSFWAIPWLLIIIVIALIVLILGWWWRRRRRAKQGPPLRSGRHKAKVKQKAKAMEPAR